MDRLTFTDPLNDAPDNRGFVPFLYLLSVTILPSLISPGVFLKLLDFLDAGKRFEDALGVGGDIEAAGKIDGQLFCFPG